MSEYPDWLPDEPCTHRQAETLVLLAREISDEAEEWVWGRLNRMKQNEAWRLIGKFGGRVADQRRERAAVPERLSL